MKQSSTSLQLNWNDKSTLNNKRFADLERIPFFCWLCVMYVMNMRDYLDNIIPMPCHFVHHVNFQQKRAIFVLADRHCVPTSRSEPTKMQY